MRHSMFAVVAVVIAVSATPLSAQTMPTKAHPVTSGADAGAGVAAAVKHTSRSFAFKNVPADGTPGTFSTFTFKAAIGGTAVVRSRGFCNVLQEASNDKEIDIESRIVGTTAFSTPVPNWGVLRVPANAATLDEQVGWTSEQQFRVVANTAYAIILVGRHAKAVTNSSNCTGTITMDIM